jgi:hypothetical protein
MTKQDLLALLDGVKQAVLFGYILIDDAGPRLDELAAKCLRSPPYQIKHRSGVHEESLQMLGALLCQPSEARLVRGNYFLLIDFALLRTSFEVIKEYAEATKQLTEFQSDGDLYKVARVARNLISHGDGAVLNEWPANFTRQGITSVTWEDITISATDVGKTVYIDSRQTFRLCNALVSVRWTAPESAA